ncbi:DUF6114 domain-containing protein [Streptomyces sp. SP18ES09]|uniref:DUF6114 domain-containing protein n=1 Tax=Streptomyces sp. SP18ES09 TaxID=3002532 RepID=UPI002E789819|nr:DUF6114 domain-containing protein [Streptomyces sp. SP18ES09]MEE1814190.1 DUF6114 domain-containing protein [Streptomyces sp. SP18ES09]
MTTDPPPRPTEGPAPGRARRAFRRWRRTRPFWAALWTGLGGFVIFFLPMAPLGKILQVGVGGIAGMAGGVLLMAMALLILLMPGQRHTAGVIAVIAGVASFPLSNLGGSCPYGVRTLGALTGGVGLDGASPRGRHRS